MQISDENRVYELKNTVKLLVIDNGKVITTCHVAFHKRLNLIL